MLAPLVSGLCSSITESCHITAVKKPWHCLNRYQALGQMLLINQQLDKVAAMHSNFTARGILSSSDVSTGAINDDYDDKSPVEGTALGHVILAQTCGMFHPPAVYI